MEHGVGHSEEIAVHTIQAQDNLRSGDVVGAAIQAAEAANESVQAFNAFASPILVGEGIRITSAKLGPLGGKGPTAPFNYRVGNEFDEYVAQTKLRGLEEAGQLGRQEQLLTPDVPGRKFVQPDYSIYNPRGNVAAYADAKTGASIGLDAQARGLVKWSTTTTSKTLIYYTPEGTTPISADLLRYARQNGVRILQVAAP